MPAKIWDIQDIREGMQIKIIGNSNHHNAPIGSTQTIQRVHRSEGTIKVKNLSDQIRPADFIIVFQSRAAEATWIEDNLLIDVYTTMKEYRSTIARLQKKVADLRKYNTDQEYLAVEVLQKANIEATPEVLERLAQEFDNMLVHLEAAPNLTTQY